MLTALDQEKWRRVLLADHPAVDADVHDAGLRIAGDDARERVDVAPALEVVPARDRELGLVHVAAADDHLFHRPLGDEPRWNRLAVFLHDVLDQIAVGDVAREPERQRESIAAAEPAGQELRAAPGLVALDVLEKERRALLLQHPARDRAELAVPVDLGRDPPELAVFLEPAHPLTHVREAHRRVTAGATSVRKRLNCPRWSHEPRRSAMCPTPASK